VAGYGRSGPPEPGWQAVTLHRSLFAQSEFRFVALAEWASADALMGAVGQPEFQAAARPIGHPAHPGVCEIVKR
jgi:Antibiotic biosynthesis monooxygenase